MLEKRRWSSKAKFGVFGGIYAATALIGAGIGIALTLSGVFAPFGAGLLGASMFALAGATPGIVGLVGIGLTLLGKGIASLFQTKEKQECLDESQSSQNEESTNSVSNNLVKLMDFKKSTYRSAKPNYQVSSNKSQPPKGSVAVFEWKTFTPLNDFSDDSLFPVLERISNDIIERPYHYDPHSLYNEQGQKVNKFKHVNAGNIKPPSKINNVAVYKQNHGTGHGLRQMIYAEKLIETLANDGNEHGKKIANSVLNNQELKNAIKLAAFCKRIGRTLDHEKDSNKPTIYSLRSAEMFKAMATELGFNSNLINIISNSMLEPCPRDENTMSSYQDVGDISGKDLSFFTSNILMASHKADLVRLCCVKQDLVNDELKYYLDDNKERLVTKNLLEFACRANAMTGNRVIRQEPGINHQVISKIDGKKLVNVRKNLVPTIQSLSKIPFGIVSSVLNKADQKMDYSKVASEGNYQLNLP